MTNFGMGVVSGPYIYFNLFTLLIALEVHPSIRNWSIAQIQKPAVDQNRILVLDEALTLARARAVELGSNMDLKFDLDRAQTAKKEFWQEVLVAPKLYSPILDTLCDGFDLLPRAQWWEALRVAFLPKIPQRITLFSEIKWRETEQAFEAGCVGETENYGAACQLLLDAWLYIFGYYRSVDESIFSHLANLTRQMDAPPLRIAHCIRDLAYGEESRAKDLVAMANSANPHYREIFEACLWKPTSEKEAKH